MSILTAVSPSKAEDEAMAIAELHAALARQRTAFAADRNPDSS